MGVSGGLAKEAVIGVVGAGAMGAGIAQVAALAGHGVRLFDARPGAAAEAVGKIGDAVAKLAAKGRVTDAQVAGLRVALRAVDAFEELAGCGLVIEAIVEDLAAKRALFAGLEGVVGRETLLATNTSSLSVTAIAEGMERPERFAGMHFFNPAPVMPLVEVVSGARTSDAAAHTLMATAAAWGKTAVRARSTPGFIVNRVARPFYAEALRALEEGAADAATIDAVMRESGGFRMGPFALMDFIGNDVNEAVTRSVFAGLGVEARFRPSARQQELVEAGELGRKTGRGWYRYADGVAEARPVSCAREPAPVGVTLYGSDALAEGLAVRLALAGVAFARAETCADERVAECAGCVLFRTDGRTATERAAALRLKDVVLVDLALDYGAATRLAIACGGETAGTYAAGLLQAGGYEVSRVEDRAGMLVLRTVAMLANGAADAVGDGVCTAEDCDVAMRKGVNYPLGPLSWADVLGARVVVRALEHIRAATGDELYRVSPLLRATSLRGGRFFAEGSA